MAELTLRDIHKSFDGRPVLRGISHTFAESSVTALVGASGSGKTTLLGIIMGLIAPDSGSVQGLPAGVGVVFQEDRLLERQDALHNVKFVCSVDVSDGEIMRHLGEVGIDEDTKRVSAFSGGMRRRVALVRALIEPRELLILDEPFKGLDELAKIHAAEYIERHRGDAITIVVTHDKNEAQLMAATEVLDIDADSPIQI